MWRRIEKGGWWIASALVALLVVLGGFQYRWLGALSDAERERAATSLSMGAEAVGRDFDRLITQVALAFVEAGIEGHDEPAVALARWRATAPDPTLVKAIWRFVPRPGGRLSSLRLDEESGGFVEMPLPPALEGLAARRQAGQRSARQRRPSTGFRPGVHDRPPSILLPRFAAAHLGLRSRRRVSTSLLIVLDEATLLRRILPELVARHLPPLAGVSPWVRVVRVDTGEVVSHTGPSVFGRRPDAEADFFRLLPHDQLGPESTLTTSASPTRSSPHRLPSSWLRIPLWDRLADGGRPHWRLEVAHSAGSLEVQVRAARRRNLGVASGVLGVLAASVVLLVASTRRAQALARQRLEMVAAVTHELRTPLAAVCSAGANLADGVVSETAAVRRYGRVIEDEGRRLARLVEQTLVYAGTLAGDAPTGGTVSGGALAGGALELRATPVEAWVTEVIERRSADLAAAGMNAQLAIDPLVPSVNIDGEAMTRVLDNLVSNAIRHAAEGGCLEIAASYGRGRRRRWGWLRETRRPDQVELTIADRGPGLSARDRRQIFEPFFRGQRARDSAKGSGLGLAVVRAIVQAHGGSVAVAPREGGGTVFTLYLPVAPAAEKPRSALTASAAR